MRAGSGHHQHRRARVQHAVDLRGRRRMLLQQVEEDDVGQRVRHPERLVGHHAWLVRFVCQADERHLKRVCASVPRVHRERPEILGIRIQRRAAWLAMTGAMAAGAGFLGFWSLSPDTRWSLTLPLLPASLVAVAIVAAREKSAVAEVAVASAFSLLAVPICLAATASLSTALAVGIAFGLVFVVGTLAARVIVLGARGGGDPRAARSTRMTVLMLTGAGTAALAATAARTLLPWTTLLAAAPGLAAGSWLAVRPPAPTRLRLVGWTLVLTSVAAALTLIASLA